MKSIKWKYLSLPSGLKKSMPRLIIVYGNPNQTLEPGWQRYITSAERVLFSNGKVESQNFIRTACRASLRLLLSNYLNVEPLKINFLTNRFGKLYLKDTQLFFNVSHTRSAFLIAINTTGSVGVDLDFLEGTEDLPLIGKYAFSENENKEIQDGNTFLNVWTRKEAALKSAGIGITKNINTFDSLSFIQKRALSYYTFICPNNETATVVTNSVFFDPEYHMISSFSDICC